jgi:hypothetical protein
VTTPTERKALNEGTFRAANEKLERAAQAILSEDEGALVPFLCECPQMDCTQVVLLTLAEYEEARAKGERGFAVLGHEDLEIERVVAQNDRFVMTEKFGLAGEIHEETFPRG